MTDQPKHPLSAYMLWLNSARVQIKSENPGLKVTEIAKKGGEIWRGMKDKSVWEEKAAKAREQYTKNLEAFNVNGCSGTKNDDEFSAMYCHLCRVDGSLSHESSSGHRAAKELAAVAVDRLSDHLAATIDDDPSTPGCFKNLDDFMKVKLPKAPATDETNKTQVFFCDSCNVTLPVADLKRHQRQKEHTLALFNEQTLEELVGQYVDKEHRRLMQAMQEPQASVEESEAVKTYTCHLCALEVPSIFKFLHEWGLRHLSCRTLAVAAAKRIRDQIRSADKSGDKSEGKSKNKSEDKSVDKSEDKPEDGSGDKSEDKKHKPIFSGKMMKKLLKLYTGKGVEEDIVEDTDGEPEEPKSVKAKRLTTKEYFTEILPYLSFVSAFHTVIVDESEFVTIQIGRDTLKIHVNNYNGINHYERHGMYYMNCILCDGFNTSMVYSSNGQGDKMHVMSLGHVKNLLAPIDNVHLIRKIDEIHSVCTLCNVYVSRYQIDNHILRDPNHTAALTEALERGKTYKDSKKHLKIMVCKPKVTTNSQQNKWNFGIPQNQNSSVLFGGQPSGFGAQSHNASNNAFRPCVNNDASYSQVGTVGTGLFGAQNNAGYGNGLSGGFGNAQKNTAAFGTAQNNGNTFSTQSNAGFSGAPTNTGFGAQNNTPFGSTQNNTASFRSAQNNAASFWSAQNKAASFGGTQNNTGFGGHQNNTSFGNSQNSGASDNKTLNARFGGHSLFKTANENTIAAIQNVGVANTTGFAATNVGFKLAGNPSQPSKQSSSVNDKNNLTSGSTKTLPNPSSEQAEKPKSPSEKNVKFTFHSNDAGTGSSVNKNGDNAQPKNGNAVQEKPDVGNKQNNYKRNKIRFSSSSSDSE